MRFVELSNGACNDGQLHHCQLKRKVNRSVAIRVHAVLPAQKQIIPTGGFRVSLTAEQLRAREGKLTASRVKVLMDGDDQALYDLWRELMGDPSYEQPDLSGVWAVQLGSLTEELNLNWYEYRTGREVIRRGEVVASQERPWAACTLDGWTEEPGNPAGGDRRETVIECKHVGGFEPLEKVVARYQPQVQWQMYVTDCDHAVLSIIEGAKEPVLEEVERDRDYLAELLRRADMLWECVETLRPPVALPKAEPPKPTTREVDMTDDPGWAGPAEIWLENRHAAKVFRSAEKAIKEIVPANAKRAHGHGIEVKRSRSGSLRIGETKQ